MQMKRKAVLVLLVLAILSLSVASFAAEKKAAPGVKEFTGEWRGADGVGRKFWIRKAEGEEELLFYCDKKSVLVTKQGKKPLSSVSDSDFIHLFKTNEKLAVKYTVAKDGKNTIKTIGPVDAAK